MSVISETYNHGCNILKLFVISPNFSAVTSETERNYNN